MSLSHFISHKRAHVKAVFRSFLFVSAVFVYAIVFNLNTHHQQEQNDATSLMTDDYISYRRLDGNITSDEDYCDGITKADPSWFAVLYFLGVLYTFVAIAIVCDELFVPALEVIASDEHLDLSMDVAGATLMAAGGSAPELFTSIFGTFVQESEVGIGTVVGSAVFNVLFVIAMCALLTKEVLSLTWWPLFRDSLCYSVGLVMLGLFVGVISPGEIELWEACVLFGMYIVYVIIMASNRKIYKKITGRDFTFSPPPPVEADDADGDMGASATNKHNDMKNDNRQDDEPVHEHNSNKNKPSNANASLRRSLRRGPSIRSVDSFDLSINSSNSHRSNNLKGVVNEEGTHQEWPGTFHSGVLKVLRRPSLSNNDQQSCKDVAGIGIVAVLEGDVNQVFQEVDIDDSGDIDKEELAQLFDKLDIDVTEQEIDMVMNELDNNTNGKITKEDFVAWYVHAEKHISNRTQTVFDYFDADKNGLITRSNLKTILETLESDVTDNDVDQAMTAMHKKGSRDEISFDEFSLWYKTSMINQKEKESKEEQENDMDDSIFNGLYPPDFEQDVAIRTKVFAYMQYLLILPIVAVLAFTVPDVRRPGWRKYCYLSFLLSILWIGVFSYYMVDWAEIIGHTIGIPSVIMGLTLLAAGTSVPDLLTSVIVARMGEGDMALSSSIGSNIFDILVGLPLPWLSFAAWKKEPISVCRKSISLFLNSCFQGQ